MANSRTKPNALPGPNNPLLTLRQAADFLSVTPEYMSRVHASGKGPPRRYVGKRPRYLQSELVAWVIQERPA